MTDRAKQIIKKFTSRDTTVNQSAIDEIKNLGDMSIEEKQELASGLVSLFYREHEGDEVASGVIENAEKSLSSLGLDVLAIAIDHLVEADSESADHFARAIGQMGEQAVQPLLEALEKHNSDQYAKTNILQTMGEFGGRDAVGLLAKALENAGSFSHQVKASALQCLGRLASNVQSSDIGESAKTSMFVTCFASLADPKPIVRLHAVRALGRMLKYSYLNEEQLEKTHKAFRAVLGLDDFDWDNAYVVRSEAEHYLHLCKSSSGRHVGPYQQDFKILTKKELSPWTFHFRISAPLIAKKIQAGQFIIIRPNSHSERIPLSICGWNREEGYLEIIIMACGRTSREACVKNVGDSFQDIVGPLGQRSHIQKYEGACVLMGGGYGTGAVIPTARDLRAKGNKVIGVVGARNKDLLIMVDELKEACDEVMITTNNGSEGIEGFVTHALQAAMDREKVSMVLAVGPVPMMMAVSNMTKDKGIECWVSLNAIMVDGTGMCGACRVSVGGKTKFACFHGPDFDGHQVDFDELTKRQKMFIDKEQIAMEAFSE